MKKKKKTQPQPQQYMRRPSYEWHFDVQGHRACQDGYHMGGGLVFGGHRACQELGE